MHWEILIIPLIALGVWLLGTLFKNENEVAKRGPRRPGSPAGRPPGRRPVTDLDRFLEEARRRREAEERRKAPSASPARPATTRTPLSERPSRNLDVPHAPGPHGPPHRRSAQTRRSSRSPTGNDPRSRGRSRARRAAPATRGRSTTAPAALRSHHNARYATVADRATGAFAVEQTAVGRHGLRAARNLRPASLPAPTLTPLLLCPWPKHGHQSSP